MQRPASFALELNLRAHVEMRGPADPRYCLVAYHGYAEGAEKPLQCLLDHGYDDGLLLAPLGPHHFYNRRGEVVASWMTRFDREERIEELLAHSRALWREALRFGGELPLFLFGFSQGGANAHRIALLGDLPVRRYFVLGADLPPEAREIRAGPKSPSITLMSGREDDRRLRSTLENDHRSLAKRGYNVEHLSLQGGHEYLPEAFEAMIQRIREEL